MFRKLAVIAAVTATLGLGSVGTAAADIIPGVPVIDHHGCNADPVGCALRGFVVGLVSLVTTGSADLS